MKTFPPRPISQDLQRHNHAHKPHSRSPRRGTYTAQPRLPRRRPLARRRREPISRPDARLDRIHAAEERTDLLRQTVQEVGRWCLLVAQVAGHRGLEGYEGREGARGGGDGGDSR